MLFSTLNFLNYYFWMILVEPAVDAQNSAQVSYVVVYGKVLSGTPQFTTTTVSYKDCLDLCMQNHDCVLAYGNTNCQLYEFGGVTSVQQNWGPTGGPDDIVSFRINRDTCPKSPTNPPTFDSYPATGKIVSNDTSYYYRITLNNSVWNFEYITQDTNVTCLDSFSPVERKFGSVCARMVDRKYSKSCDSYHSGALYSAVEVPQELNLAFANAKYYNTTVHVNAMMTILCRDYGNCETILNGVHITLPTTEINWLEDYPNDDGDCVAVKIDNYTDFGYYNRDCNVNPNVGIDYCVYLP